MSSMDDIQLLDIVLLGLHRGSSLNISVDVEIYILIIDYGNSPVLSLVRISSFHVTIIVVDPKYLLCR
jgi:hypothetical protein